jgi:hypothetical protein
MNIESTEDPYAVYAGYAVCYREGYSLTFTIYCTTVHVWFWVLHDPAGHLHDFKHGFRTYPSGLLLSFMSARSLHDGRIRERYWPSFTAFSTCTRLKNPSRSLVHERSRLSFKTVRYVNDSYGSFMTQTILQDGALCERWSASFTTLRPFMMVPNVNDTTTVLQEYQVSWTKFVACQLCNSLEGARHIPSGQICLDGYGNQRVKVLLTLWLITSSDCS